MTIHYEGEELTLQQAGVYLKNNDRTQREVIYQLIQERRLQDSKTIDILSCNCYF